MPLNIQKITSPLVGTYQHSFPSSLLPSSQTLLFAIICFPIRDYGASAAPTGRKGRRKKNYARVVMSCGI